jgi:hypothetical protein
LQKKEFSHSSASVQLGSTNLKIKSITTGNLYSALCVIHMADTRQMTHGRESDGKGSLPCVTATALGLPCVSRRARTIKALWPLLRARVGPLLFFFNTSFAN